MSATIESLVNKEYAYGFVSDIDSCVESSSDAD